MSYRDCVLSMDGWIRNQVKEEVQHLNQIGPVLKVVSQVDGQTPLQIYGVIDTAAAVTRFSKSLAHRLGYHGEEKGSDAPMCLLTFHNGTRARVPIEIDTSLQKPCELAIGRDILRHSRIVIDFTSGAWELHFRAI